WVRGDTSDFRSVIFGHGSPQKHCGDRMSFGKWHSLPAGGIVMQSTTGAVDLIDDASVWRDRLSSMVVLLVVIRTTAHIPLVPVLESLVGQRFGYNVILLIH